MKKILLVLMIVTMVFVINSCEKEKAVSGAAPNIDLINNPPEGCHVYTAQQLERLKIKFKEQNLLNEDGMVIGQLNADSKVYPPGTTEVFCLWLHWGMCCPPASSVCNFTYACPVCGGNTGHNFGCDFL